MRKISLHNEKSFQIKVSLRITFDVTLYFYVFILIPDKQIYFQKKKYIQVCFPHPHKANILIKVIIKTLQHKWVV